MGVTKAAPAAAAAVATTIFEAEGMARAVRRTVFEPKLGEVMEESWKLLGVWMTTNPNKSESETIE
jgi:hypothetical protein